MALSMSQSISSAANALALQSQLNYTANVGAGQSAGSLGAVLGGSAAETEDGKAEGASFENALLKAMDGVNAYQTKGDDLLQAMIVDPDSVDAQDVTIAMSEANLSLNLAKTILSRVVTAWKDVINTR
jgi:flagellar hook-basal body complex protein FliE